MVQLWRLVALVWVPFVSIFAFAAPPLVTRVGDSHPHVLFHLLATVLLAAATVTAWRLRRAAGTRAQRALLGVLLVSVPGAVLGNALELVAAVDRLASDGWESRRTEDLFGEGGGLHFWASNLTIPCLLVSMVVVLAAAVTAAVQERQREPVPRAHT